MNLTWHMVRKDARRLWAPLVLWAIVITGHGYLEWALAHAVGEDAVQLERRRFFILLFSAIHIITGYVLAATLLLEDSPIGTEAFWLTRPISGARLLGAKAVAALLLFIGFPALVSLPWILVVASDAAELRAAIAALMGSQAWVVAMAAVVATCTGNLAKLVAWTLGLFPAAGIVLIVGSFFGRRSVVDFLARTNLSRMTATPGFVIVILGLFGAIFIQYHLRRREWALAVLAASTAGAIAIAFGGFR